MCFTPGLVTDRSACTSQAPLPHMSQGRLTWEPCSRRPAHPGRVPGSRRRNASTLVQSSELAELFLKQTLYSGLLCCCQGRRLDSLQPSESTFHLYFLFRIGHLWLPLAFRPAPALPDKPGCKQSRVSTFCLCDLSGSSCSRLSFPSKAVPSHSGIWRQGGDGFQGCHAQRQLRFQASCRHFMQK